MRLVERYRRLSHDLRRRGFDEVTVRRMGRVERELRDLPDGEYTASDVLEGDGVTDADIPIAVTVTVDGPTLDVYSPSGRSRSSRLTRSRE